MALDGTYKTVYGIDQRGRVLPRSARGRKRKGQRDISVDARSFLHGEHDPESISVWSGRDQELAAIENFAIRVGITNCPDGVAKNASWDGSNPQMQDVKEFISVRTKRFRMDGDLQSTKIKRRIMASEHKICPVCNRLFPGPVKSKCPDCGHDMRRKAATRKEIEAWLKSFGELPLNMRTYRGFTYKDLERYALEATHHHVSFNEVANTFNRLFPIGIKVNGGEDWMRLMVGYELQRRLMYPMGEPTKVEKRRLDLRKGIIPKDIKNILEAIKKNKEDKRMASKTKAKKTKKDSNGNGGFGRIDCMGHPVTAVLRWMGKEGFTSAQARGVMEELDVPVSPVTVQIQVNAGAKGERGEPAELSTTDEKTIRGIAKKIPARATQSKDEEEDPKPAKAKPKKKVPPKKKKK